MNRFIIVLIFGFLFLSSCDIPSNEDTLKWMKEKSGVVIPSESEIVEYSDIDYGKIFKFKLSDSLTTVIINDNNLHQVYNTDEVKFVLYRDIEQKGFEVTDKSYYYIYDCNEYFNWKLLMERGEEDILWFELLHSDNGGDNPGCDSIGSLF